MKTFAVARKRPSPGSLSPRMPFALPADSHRPTDRTAVRQILRGPRLQAKLTIGAPNDICEQEADRVADQVMRKTEPPAQAKPGCCADACFSIEEERLQFNALPGNAERQLQRRIEEKALAQRPQTSSAEEGARALSPGYLDPVTALRAGGRPLAASERVFFEPRIGLDLGQVQIHTGIEAAEAARAFNAKAFTLGHHIAFASNQYAPGTDNGKRLMAHELVHVVQQTETGKVSMQRRFPLDVSTTEGQLLPAPKPEDGALGLPQPDCATPVGDIYELHGTITSTNPACSAAGVKDRRKGGSQLLKVVRADYGSIGKDICPGFPGVPDLDTWLSDQWRVVAIDRFQMTVTNMCGDEERLTVSGRGLNDREIQANVPQPAPAQPTEQTIPVEPRTSTMKCAKVSFDLECDKISCIYADASKPARVFLWNPSINEYVDQDDENNTKTPGALALLMGVITKEYQGGQWRGDRCGDARW